MLSSSWDGAEGGLLFASILGIVAQWTEEESLQLIEIYKTNVIHFIQFSPPPTSGFSLPLIQTSHY
jgi:hypothetical protein